MVRDVAQRMHLLGSTGRERARVITVAGTNGKGSTVAYLDALLRAHGFRTGRFTSPHLRRYNERIAIDGIEATDARHQASSMPSVPNGCTERNNRRIVA